MFGFLNSFLASEDGAVTVDWVVLCAGLVAMAALIAGEMRTGTVAAADATVEFMEAQR